MQRFLAFFQQNVLGCLVLCALAVAGIMSFWLKILLNYNLNNWAQVIICEYLHVYSWFICRTVTLFFSFITSETEIFVMHRRYDFALAKLFMNTIWKLSDGNAHYVWLSLFWETLSLKAWLLV